jgi:hypothetical protein
MDPDVIIREFTDNAFVIEAKTFDYGLSLDIDGDVQFTYKGV